MACVNHVAASPIGGAVVANKHKLYALVSLLLTYKLKMQIMGFLAIFLFIFYILYVLFAICTGNKGCITYSCQICMVHVNTFYSCDIIVKILFRHLLGNRLFLNNNYYNKII